MKYAIGRASDSGLARHINWAKFLRAVEEQNGAAVDITR
jgi:hypothetical protein